MEILAIIPARGGSKGIKRKNLRPIYSKPLVAYSIEAGLNSKFITKSRINILLFREMVLGTMVVLFMLGRGYIYTGLVHTTSLYKKKR